MVVLTVTVEPELKSDLAQEAESDPALEEDPSLGINTDTIIENESEADPTRGAD